MKMLSNGKIIYQLSKDMQGTGRGAGWLAWFLLPGSRSKY